MSKDDYTSRDWLAFSTKRLINNVDPSISVNLVYNSDGGMNIVISNISEKVIDKLPFLTNTDYNNNYLYLEKFDVYIDGTNDTNEIQGLNDIAISMFQNSDINAHISSKKMHYPFASSNIYNQIINPNTITFNELIDLLANVIPYTQSTSSHIKKYSMVLNPDKSSQAVIGSSVGPTKVN